MSIEHPRLGARMRALVTAWQHRAYELEMTPDSNETTTETACRLATLAQLEFDIMELRDVLDGKANPLLEQSAMGPGREITHRTHCAPTRCKYGDTDCPVVAEHEAAENAIDSLPRAVAMRRRLDAAMLDLDEMIELQTTEHGERMLRYARSVVAHVTACDDFVQSINNDPSTRKAQR